MTATSTQRPSPVDDHAPPPSLLRRLLPGLSAEAAMAALEERAAWARLGL